MKKLKLKKKNLIIIISIAVALVAAVAVGVLLINKDDERVTTKKKNETTPVKEIKIVDLESNSRPYAVMINNIGAARPLQSGLQDAYIIYEIIVEGGLTRYLALFIDQDTERIGSIRSARHYYLDYALENDAIYVHHGQSPQAASDFSKLGIDRIVADNSKTGWRDKTLNVASEHTLFTSIEKLENGIGKKRTEREKDLLLEYSAEEVDLSKHENAEVANNVSIKYSSSVTSSYEYDEENKVYNRFVNNKEHKDYVTGDQYTFKNIMYMYIVSILLGGILYLFNIEVSSNPLFTYLIMIVISIEVMVLYVKEIKMMKSIYNNYYKVDIYFKDNDKVSLTSFVDTGNNLYDPYKKRPIILVSNKYRREGNYILVPYHTISGEGLLECIKPEMIFIEGIGYKGNLLIGFSDSPSFIDGVDVILHKDLMKGRWLC